MKKRNVLIIILLLVSLGTAYFIGKSSVKEVEPEVITINLAKSERLQAIQNARLNWISLDSAMTWLEGLEPTNRINWVDKTIWYDSTNWSDSTKWNVKDSTAIVYIPFYEAEDTIVNFDEIVKKTRVQLSLLVKPRFFPTLGIGSNYGGGSGGKFVTDVQMRRLTLTKPREVESFWKHRLVLTLGYGIGYYKSTTQTNNTFIYDNDYNDREFTLSTQVKWQFNHGLQLTLGIRIW